ncbi:MAG: hypothetical protein PHW76_00610 [Alphaproteobacteria bacterium]|nr:hypothetical protein [Alphaproteobacteria bacterium]
MTDTFGSSPQDNNENMSADNALKDVQDSSIEAPPAEAPSEYEFSDELPPDEIAAAPAKRSAALPLAVALAGIVLLGGTAWWQMGGKSMKEINLAQAPAGEDATRPAPPPNEAPALVSDQSNGGTQVSETPAPVPVPTPEVQAIPAEPTPASVAAAPAPLSLPPSPQPATVSTDASHVQAVPLPPPPAAQAPTATSDAQNRIDTLTTRVEDLQKALDLANQQLSQIEDDSSASKKNLEERLKQLEKRIGRKQVGQSANIEGAASDEAGAAVKKSIRHKMAPKARKSAVNSEPATTWVLRAAAPGEGLIAKNAETNDFKKVHVGDAVESIGKVVAIEAQGDSWIVRGTKGSIQ